MTMKTLIFLFAFLVSTSVSSSLFGGRRSSLLKDYEWKVSDKILSSANSEGDSIYPFTFSGILKKDQVLQTNIPIADKNFAAAVLNLDFETSFFSVYVNDELLLNELDGQRFHADVSRFTDSDSILLQLKVNRSIEASVLEQWIDSWSVDFHTGLVLCHARLSHDAFFGTKLLEVTVKNYSGTDIDGKIYARILDADTWDLLSENNNCAFSRSGNEVTIEINFPEFPEAGSGKKLLAEVIMVDKEKNEEVIDQLDIPLRN